MLDVWDKGPGSSLLSATGNLMRQFSVIIIRMNPVYCVVIDDLTDFVLIVYNFCPG